MRVRVVCVYTRTWSRAWVREGIPRHFPAARVASAAGNYPYIWAAGFLLRAGRADMLLTCVVSTATASLPDEDVYVAHLQKRIGSAIAQICSPIPSASPARMQACQDARRFEAALAESGHRLMAEDHESWRVLEGDALKHHLDPLGALQRGEVPAIALRQFVPAGELAHMQSRMAQMTLKIFSCRFPVNMDPRAVRSVRSAREHRITSNDSYCAELNRHTGQAALTWAHWCTLLTNVAHDCNRLRTAGRAGGQAWPPECEAFFSGHPVFERCLYVYGKKRRGRVKVFRQDHTTTASAYEFGQKLYGNLQTGAKHKFMRGSLSVDALHEMMGRGCSGRFCSPKQAMLTGIAELAGSHRATRQAEENAGERHSPGTVRSMVHGWATPLHMDSKHSSAWAALRKELCGEVVRQTMGTSPAEASRFQALTRHRFAASAIFTMNVPNRTTNPIDLNIFRTRWPALLYNCSVRTVDAYGVGARFQRDTMPAYVLSRPVEVRADPGDLFLFNSEFFHDTPRISGTGSRTVFNSFAGYSSDGAAVEVYA